MIRSSASLAAIDAVPLGRRGVLLWQVLGEIRWSFLPPWNWLSGAAANLVLSIIWLIGYPLTGGAHHDWAILVGTYFSTFILADITTTNVLGLDSLRVRVSLYRQVPLHRILLVKNLALLVIIGLPTLIATTVLTLDSEGTYRLAVTIPGVLFPIMTWLGVGNLVSVILPVATVPMAERWARRTNRRATLRWLISLGLPYVLLEAVDPLSDAPRLIFRDLKLLPSNTDTRGFVLVLLALGAWSLGTAAALAVVRARGVRIR